MALAATDGVVSKAVGRANGTAPGPEFKGTEGTTAALEEDVDAEKLLGSMAVTETEIVSETG